MELPLYADLAGSLNLNLGCGMSHIDEPGSWLNLDSNPVVKPDVVWNLEDGLMAPELLLYVEAASRSRNCASPHEVLDLIVASHVFEHVRNIFRLVSDCYDLLRPGGRLLIVTPHASSDDAVDSPHHVRVFTERSFHYFTRLLYLVEGAGCEATQGEPIRDWRIEKVYLIPEPEFLQAAQTDPDFPRVAAARRNVYKEVHAILRKEIL